MRCSFLFMEVMANDKTTSLRLPQELLDDLEEVREEEESFAAQVRKALRALVRERRAQRGKPNA